MSRECVTYNEASELRELNELKELFELFQMFMDQNTVEEIIEKRRWHVRPINIERRLLGADGHLINEMLWEDDESFFNFTRMPINLFNDLYRKIVLKLTKKCTRPDVIPPRTRLILTLRYLACGDSFGSLHYLFRIGRSTIPKIIYETCDFICEALLVESFPTLNANKLLSIAQGFQVKTTFPHIIGAIDGNFVNAICKTVMAYYIISPYCTLILGKHIQLRAPPNSGSKYYNYKKTSSIVLLAVCDAQLSFTYVNIGSFGSESDCGILKNSEFGKNLENGEFDFPQPMPINNSTCPLPYWFLGDAAFPLRSYMMTPYGGRNLHSNQINFNRELSRGRVVIENAFGVLAARFQILLNTMNIWPQNADKVVRTAVTLHNYLIKNDANRYLPPEFLDEYDVGGILTEGNWREIVGSGFPIGSTRRSTARSATSEAIALRNTVRDLMFGNEPSS